MLDSFWLQFLLTLLFLMLLLSLPAYLAWRNWQQHAARRQLATAHGWRYSPRGWRAFWQRHFQLVGAMPEGPAGLEVVWELRPTRRYHQIFYRWETTDVALPYGVLLILPAHPGSPKHLLGLAKPGVRPYTLNMPQWHDEFRLLVTHNQLGDRYFDADIAAAMLTWPAWPAAGALEEIVWDKGGLIIVARYDTDWQLFERMVRLGSQLVTLHANAQPLPAPAATGA